MAESLGEAFVEVLADTSPFGDSLESGISDALSGIEGEVESALGEIPAIADQAFGDTVGSADDAASEIGSAFGRMTDTIQENLGKITIGAAAGGAALEGFARSQRDTRVEARNLAGQLGMTDDEMLSLIADTSDATFPLEDVTALMQLAAQRGIDGSDALGDFANFWDMVGDASGESAVDLAEAGVALGRVGISAGDEGEALDAFGFIMNNTQADLTDFLRVVGRVGGEFGDQAPSVDEMAAALSALEAEGLDARVAQSELRTELTKAEGDIVAALEALGVSEDAYRGQIDAVEGSGSAIEANAERFAEARTPIERMTAAIQAQLFEMPFLAEGASMLAAPLAAVGPAAMGMTHGIQAISMISGGVTKALGVLRVGFVKLGAAILANPIFLIGALLIGVAILIWKFRDEIIEALVGAWEWIKEKVGALVEWFRTAIPDAIAAVVDWVKENWPLILAIITGPIGLAVKFILDNWDAIKDGVRRAVEFIRRTIRRIFDAILTFIRTTINRIRDFVVNGFNTLRDRATSAIERMRDSVRNILNTVVDFVKDLPARVIRGLGNLGSLLFDKGRDMIQGLLDGARSLLKNIGSFFLNIVPGWIRGPFEKALGISSPSKVFAEIGRDTMEGFSVGVDDELRRVQRTMSGLGQGIPMDLRTDEIQGSIQAGGGMVRSQEIRVEINNPAPEPASVSISREMRKLAATGVFDG